MWMLASRSAEGWEEVLLPEIERHAAERGVKYAIRLPANENLERDIEELLTRPTGRPSTALQGFSLPSPQLVEGAGRRHVA